MGTKLDMIRETASSAVSLPLWLPVAMGAGVGLYFTLPVEPPLILGFICFALALALFVIRWRQTGRAMLLLLLFTALGFLAAQWRSAEVAAPILTTRVGPITLEGMVYRWEEEAAGRDG